MVLNLTVFDAAILRILSSLACILAHCLFLIGRSASVRSEAVRESQHPDLSFDLAQNGVPFQ